MTATSLASLPMYDRPETAAANDRLWQAIRAELGYGPRHLTRDGDLWAHWTSPDLLLSQTCGYPFRARLNDKVTLVATPDYDLPDCPTGHYCSALVVRVDDPRQTPTEFATARFAYNDPLSQSGWAAPQNFAALQGFTFSNPKTTGGHRAYALAVAEGHADIASLDALTWALIQRHDDFSCSLREIARTPPTPALPYITAPGNDADGLFDALEAAIGALTASDRHTLGLRGLTRLPAQAYLDVPNPAPPPAETA